ncbi:MAG: tyrosine-protein phosphatase [Candidatus Eremiobacteraeota bacterium]|nr:tyrosine-protein phosphatase [Candidatus Eremiobacteraeota bacterium]
MKIDQAGGVKFPEFIKHYSTASSSREVTKTSIKDEVELKGKTAGKIKNIIKPPEVSKSKKSMLQHPTDTTVDTNDRLASSLYEILDQLETPEELSAFGDWCQLNLKGDTERNMAGRVYEKLFKKEPAIPASPYEKSLARKFLPRIFVNPREPFALKDLIVIIHPEKPLIGYHLVWEDDIDFPDDCEPSDHEIIWVKYDPESLKVKDVYTFWHSNVIHSKIGARDANEHGGRPIAYIQWGKHGTLPKGWQKFIFPGKTSTLDGKSLESLSFPRLTQRIRMPGHPVAKKWPKKYSSPEINDFVNFTKPVDSEEVLNKTNIIVKSRFPNAVLFDKLSYNTHPKIDWPLKAEKEEMELAKAKEEKRTIKNKKSREFIESYLKKLKDMKSPRPEHIKVIKGLEEILRAADEVRDFSDKTDCILSPTVRKIERQEELVAQGKNFIDALGETHLDSVIPNFGIVEENTLYRGSQPTEAGLKWLKKIGVKTVINLREKGVEDKYYYRSIDRTGERELCKKLGLNYYEISIADRTLPTEAQVRKFINIVSKSDNQPAYIHCQAGMGRTGIMAGIWRTIGKGEDVSIAREKMKEFGLSPDKFPDHFWQINFVETLSRKMKKYPEKHCYISNRQPV